MNRYSSHLLCLLLLVLLASSWLSICSASCATCYSTGDCSTAVNNQYEGFFCSRSYINNSNTNSSTINEYNYLCCLSGETCNPASSVTTAYCGSSGSNHSDSGNSASVAAYVFIAVSLLFAACLLLLAVAMCGGSCLLMLNNLISHYRSKRSRCGIQPIESEADRRNREAAQLREQQQLEQQQVDDRQREQQERDRQELQLQMQIITQRAQKQVQQAQREKRQTNTDSSTSSRDKSGEEDESNSADQLSIDDGGDVPNPVFVVSLDDIDPEAVASPPAQVSVISSSAG